MRFWDSSALVPLLVEEPTTAALLGLLDSDAEMVVWWGAPVECTSALARLEREGALGSAGLRDAVERLRRLSDAWREMLPADVIRSTAQRLLRVHPLRAGDALQLSAAIAAAEQDPTSLPFVCLDERLADAASREGFSIVQG